MSLKSLFGRKNKARNVTPLSSFKDQTEEVESIGYIDQFIKDRRRFKSHTNFNTASNFCVYGSLEEYYESGISRIISSYPYDGSLKEKLEWINESSGFDLHIFENEYPRTNGYIKLSENRPGGNGWGTVTSTSGAYGNPASKEYIYIKGGPNVGNTFNTSSHQSSNLEINGRTGNTIEFWMKKPEYVSSKTTREVIFDITTTGSFQGSSPYGRLTVELDSSDSSASPFLITYQSGSDGIKEARIGSTQLYASASDDAWHHYAISLKNDSSKVKTSLYIDGELNSSVLTGSSIGSLNTALIGTIGALASGKDVNFVSKTSPDDFIPGLGYGKLSGSLDEFRFWKSERSHKEVGRFWSTPIGAGANTDTSNSQLGVYYKFNEGKTGIVNRDKNVLDFGGRVSNGLWVGYDGYGRYNNSAMIEASASKTEFKDPILHREHPLVSSFITTSAEKGYAYDLENTTGLYHSYPNWIVDEDGAAAEDLKKITQVMASYFDSLFLQIRDLSTLRHAKYSDFENKPYPFNSTRLESMGLVVPELFMDASTINSMANRDEDKQYEQSLSDVKNFIYNNIYNNLESIFKSKGTEKSFRNLFRCFGVDNDLIKINLYSTDSTYPIESSFKSSTVKTKYVNFSDNINKNASVYQSLDGLVGDYRTSDASSYMTGSEELLADNVAASIGLTAEAQVFFPKLYPMDHPFYFNSPLSSSLFGCYSVKQKTEAQAGTDVAWRSTSADDLSNFQVYAVKEKKHSRTAKLVLKSRNDIFDAIETDYILDLYDSNRWNIAFRLGSEMPPGSTVSGSSNLYKFELYAANTIGDSVNESYHLRRSVSADTAKDFIKNSRRFYIGANRRDFTGNLLYPSDVKVANFRVWNTALTNEEINFHAIDPSSYGLSAPSRLSFPIADIGNAQIPNVDLLALNWDVSNLTGSNSNGDMWVSDISSGSYEDDASYGKLSPIIRRIHPGKGINFASATTSSVDVEYDQAVKLQEFENVGSTDMVKVLLNDDITFTRETKPTDYYFSFEKSMYSTISDEMLNFFAGIAEFSNVFGAPIERYRPQYKGLSKLRQIFFSKIMNEPDIERYTEYYKWLDASLSVMIDQLIPASVASSEDIQNVIQSHVLERSKYYNKFPTMEMKQAEPVGQIRAINELLYSWKFGHAPLDDKNNVNCLWTRERAQRNTDILVSGSDATDSDREILRRVSVTSVSGSTYAVRKLSRPYKLSVEDQRHAKGGDNTFGNKKKRLYTGISTAHGFSHIAITGSEASTTACKDVVNPNKKHKFHGPADIAFTSKDMDINDIAPFSMYSSSLDSASDYHAEVFSGFKKGVEISNLHSDEYGDDREITLQSPFTEKWVGGNAHRHQDLSGSLLGGLENKKANDRVEAFKILPEGNKLYVLPPNADGLDSSYLPIINHDIQTAQVLRDPLAKRPVNIRNIATTTGSISLGNYNHIYDIVQYTSEDQRKDFLVDNLEQVTSSNSTGIPGVQEFGKFARPARKSVFKARFAAPGGTEVSGDSRGGHSLDRATNQYSVYNSLNYRNMSVRGPLDFLNKIPQTASTDSNSLVTNHKINNNPRYSHRLERDYGEVSDTDYGTTNLSQDNVFVQHPIPRNDYQYAWITASLLTGRSPVELAGHLHSFTQATLGTATGSLRYERTYPFISGSEGNVSGSARGGAGRVLPWGGHQNSPVGHKQETYNISFTGMNLPGSDLIDVIDIGTNTVTNTTSGSAFLSGTILHRQGPYGWPSWKQIRVGDSALGRYYRRNNLYSIPVVDGGGLGVELQATTLGNYSWPNNTEHESATRARHVSNINYRFTDPPVSINRHPISLLTISPNVPYLNLRAPVSAEPSVPTIPYTGIPNPNNFELPAPAPPVGSAFAGLTGGDTVASSLGSFRVTQKKYSFGNNLTKFANEDLTTVLRMRNSNEKVAEELLKDDLLTYDFTVPSSKVDYSFDIFPKESNTFLERTRERTQFKTDDFWKSKRSDRTRTDQRNSQGLVIPKLSCWPLDEPENFRTTAIKKTTDYLGGEGAGELFANYSVFHNNLHHPSASALFARPFPTQATSSLPNGFNIYQFKLAASYGMGMSFPGGFNSKGRGNHEGYRFRAANDTNVSSSEGTLFNLTNNPSLPPGWIAGYYNSANKTASFGSLAAVTNPGPRIQPTAKTSGDYVGPMLMMGSSIAKVAMYDPPMSNTYSYYRWVNTTASYDFPGKVTISLKTGNDASEGDNFGIHKSTTPFFIQIGAEDVGYRTIARIGGTTAEIEEYADEHIFKHVEAVITASLTNQKIRFVSVVTGSQAANDISGQWAFNFVNVYSLADTTRELNFKRSSLEVNLADVCLPEFTASVVTGKSQRAHRVANSSRKIFGSNTSQDFSTLSTVKLYNYADHRSFVFTEDQGGKDSADGQGDAFVRKFRFSETSGNFDFVFQNSGAIYQNIYAKDEKLDHHLYGSQFFKTPEQAGRNPFNFDNYEDFAYQSKLISKDYGLLPEFRMSEHMDYYLNTVGGEDPFFSCNDTLLSLTGASAPTNSSQNNFYETYSHTDFVKHFDVVTEQMATTKGASATKLKLECKAFKKFLPYKGFYPVDRTVQLASEFSSSYNQYITGGLWRSVLAPYYAPGIAFNTIKSGIAVDYPTFEPHEDRMYNKFGVIFMSSSCSTTHGGRFHDSEARPEARYSKNRIEIAGGSEWSKSLTGSLADGNHKEKLGLSFWMYLPTGTERYYALRESMNALGKERTALNTGNIISLGSGEIEDVHAASKKGIHVGFSTSNSNNNNGLSSAIAGWDGSNDFGTYFTFTGGDGKDFFTAQLTPDDSTHHRNGWNHYYVEMDIGTVAQANFRAFINGREYQDTAIWVTSSAGFAADGSGTAKIKLEGSRNCYIGNNLGFTKAVNAIIAAKATVDQSVGYNLNTTLEANSDNILGVVALKPAEHMMTDFMIFNSGIPQQSIRQLAGVYSEADADDTAALEANLPKGPDSTSGALLGGTGTQFNAYATVRHANEKPQIGPRNPYTILPREKHKNLIAWYRPGNDTGYKNKNSSESSDDYLYSAGGITNKLPVFNHAADLYSGKTIISTGSVESRIKDTGDTGQQYREDVGRLVNHLSGTFYGFNEWSGSVAEDLKWSDQPRQKWNGIADLSNPTQYTYTYYTAKKGSVFQAQGYRTWKTVARDNLVVYSSTADHKNERHLRDQHISNLTASAFTFITGAYKVPSYVVGSRFNFTDDASIPRIGSASFGTYHYTGSNDIGSEPLTSLGFIDQYQSQTGIRKSTRIPFEAIISPEQYTPKNKDDGDLPIATFYDLEPHPSASLLGYATINRRQKPDGATEWTGSFNVTNAVKNAKFSRGVAIQSSSLMAEFNLDLASSERSLYTAAASNFYAEALNLFNENGKGVTIRSNDIPQEVDRSYTTYEADIILGSGARAGARDNPMYNNPAAFGMPIDAGRKKLLSQNNFNLPKHTDLVGYGFAPYLPPHYDGLAVAKLKFTPDPNTQYSSIEHVLSETEVIYSRDISATGSISSRASGHVGAEISSDIPNSYNKKFAMNLSASLNGLAFNNLIKSYDNNGNLVSPIRRSLVIQTKFECPTFDFTKISNSELDQPRTSKAVQHLPKIKGVWHQTGSFNSSARPFVAISPPRANQSQIGDLKALLGLNIEDSQGHSKYIGELPGSRTIREAVVAIPFKTVNNVRKFFNLPPQEVYQAVRNLGYKDYKLQSDEDRRNYEDLLNRFGAAADPVSDTAPRRIPVRPSIQSMVSSLMKYNIPPQFNFLKYNNERAKFIKPFAMYVFDFSATLSKSELAKIWQNVTPDIGLDTYGSRNESRNVLTSRTVEHDLFDVDDLLNPRASIRSEAGTQSIQHSVTGWTGGIDEELQWMVFKIKQKAEPDYFRKKQLDAYPDGHPEKQISVENDIFSYGFNWPYDYFSLVELVKLKSTVSYERKSDQLDQASAITLERSREGSE